MGNWMENWIDRISDWVQRPKILVGLILVITIPLLVFLLNYGYNAVQKSKEMSLTQELFEIETQYQAALKKLQSEKNPSSNPAEAPSEKIPLSSEEFNQRFGLIEGKFRDFIAKNSGSRVAALASFSLLEIYQNHSIEQFDTELLEVTQKARGPLGHFAKMKLGLEWANRGKCDQAIKVWDDLITSARKGRDDLWIEQAQLRKAACLIQAGDLPGARTLLEPLARKEESSPVKELSIRYLRAVDL